MSTNEFLQPWTPGPTKDYSNNFNLHIGTRVQFGWADDLTSPTEFRLVQDNHPGDAQGGPDVTISDSITGTSYTWTVSYLGLDPAFNNVFYISIIGPESANTHYFNISNSAPETLPSSSSISSALPSSTSGFTAAANPTNPNSTSSPTQTVIVSSGLGPGPVAGIAIGAVIGALLLIGALWLGWRAYRRRQASLQQNKQDHHPDDISKQAELHGSATSQQQQQQQQQQHSQWFGNGNYPPMASSMGNELTGSAAGSGVGTGGGAYQGGYYYTGQDGKQYYHEAPGNEVYEAGDTQVRRYQLS